MTERSTENYVSVKTVLVRQTQLATLPLSCFCLLLQYFYGVGIPCVKAVKTFFFSPPSLV